MKTLSGKAKPDGRIKLKVQRIIVLFSVLIFAGKLIAYFLTNSVGILTDALESTVNVITGFISLYSIFISIKPKDRNHPFGHGKAEFLSASLEGILIIIAGLIIIFEAIKRLFEPSVIGQLDIGILIVAGAGALNYAVGWYSIFVGRKNNSIALVSGGKHLQSDTYSSIGLVVGLILLYYTEIAWLDSAIALLFGAIIIITGYKILKVTTSNLTDEADFKIIGEISDLLKKNRTDDWIDVHNLKLVKYGSSYHITCCLVLPWYWNIAQSHDEGDKLKNVLTNHFSGEIVFGIHTDPCYPYFCEYCRKKNCVERKKDFSIEIEWSTDNIIKEKICELQSSKAEDNPSL
ncbi:MAG: cation diffusion facilitator family transporter [Bacteroidota bacterium]